MRKAIGWILFIFILMTLFIVLNREEGGPRREVPLSEFRDQLLAGKVAHVSVGSDRLRGEFEQPLARDDEPVTRFRVVLPSGTSSSWPFTQWLLENRNGATIDVSATDSLLLNIFVPLIPWLLIFGFIWFFVFRQIRNANQKPKEPLPVIVVNRRDARAARRLTPHRNPRDAACASGYPSGSSNSKQERLVAEETVVANAGQQARPARVGPRPQLKILGILGLLVAIAVITASINGTFLLENNVENLVRRTALYGILGIGVAFVIITGGIDLSIGSVVALVGCLLPFLIKMEFRTPDQREILEVNQGAPTLLVAGAFDSLKPGDFLHVSGDGPNKIVLPVKAVRFDPQFDFYGRRQPATQVELTQPVPVPIAVGKATKAYKIASVDAPTRNLEIATTDKPPVARDRITLASADGTGLYQVEVLSAGPEPDHVHLEVTDPSQRLGRIPFQYAMIQRHAQPMTVPLAVTFLLLLSAGIGLFHGLLITKLKLQPFVVTLCGLLLYRGIARGITADQTQGFGTLFTDLRYLATGNPFAIPVPFLNWMSVRSTSGPLWTWIDVPMPFVIMMILAVIAAIFLNRTIYGRYLLALGRNEQAARYSGINTDRMVILAYVICSLLAGLGGMLFIFDTNTGQPVDFGNFYELYAIAAAVLGGCSLRGGEGTILGVVIGAAVMQVLYNSINLLKIPTQLEFAIIGAVILAGVIVDELAKRFAAKRRADRERAGLAVTAVKGG